MAIRLIVTITAAAGKGDELARLYPERMREIMEEPGCEQFEVFQSLLNPDRLVLLEKWSDPAALEDHAQRNKARKPMPPELRAGPSEREDYEYKRTR